ncbi:MAG: hypothetical protein H7Y10_03610 [Flavobacterium sp.]|nr:hypothetical protein [Flavobacterium sp.]
MFYLGHIAEEVKVDTKTRLARNKAKSWKYGYDESIDVIIISKDGTLGEIYYVSGLYIGFPEKPDHKEIINWDKTAANQKWQRESTPKGLTEETQFNKEYIPFIESQFQKREEGIWIYLNGKAVYIPGTYWFFLSWYKEEDGYPKLRIIQNELMIFWEACKADYRSYGIIHLKNRRAGWSALCNSEKLEVGSKTENKLLGMISKKGADAKKLFKRLVTAFKRLPPFFQPEVDGNTTPKTELIFSEASKKRKTGEKITEGEGLDTVISWANTEGNAFDGDKMFRVSVDECAKWPKDVPFSQYWGVVKTCLRLGSRIIGKAMVGSTVNAMKKGGSEFKKVWEMSDQLDRNQNNQTKSGLYRLFIDAAFCIEGFFDLYGFSIVEDPEKPVLNELNEYKAIGSATFLKNELDSLKDEPEEYNEQLRQFPRSERDAFRDEATDCSFNLNKILEQVDHNENELLPEDVETGNLTWENGIQGSTVKWNPNPKGRFWIAKGCHPTEDFRNKKEKKLINGITAWAPTATHIGCFGVDPYNRSKTVDSRGSKGSAHLSTKTNTSSLPNEAFIVEYIDRPATVELFFEDMLMMMVYFSMPMLCELSNEKFLTMIKNRGYRHFSMNNPFKNWAELSDTEKEYGGIPPQDAKVGEQQFYAIESYIEDYIGVAREKGNRKEGEMGFMPFTRTLMQWKDVDPTQRTKFDAYISSSLSRLGNQKLEIKMKPKETRSIPFTRYNNSGNTSVRL